MWGLVTLAVLSAQFARPVFLAIATNWFALLLAQGLLLAYAGLWVILTVDTLRPFAQPDLCIAHLARK